MLKYTSCGDKITLCIKFRKKWAEKLVNSCPIGFNFYKTVELPKDIQTNIARIQWKIKDNKQLCETNREYMTTKP